MNRDCFKNNMHLIDLSRGVRLKRSLRLVLFHTLRILGSLLCRYNISSTGAYEILYQFFISSPPDSCHTYFFHQVRNLSKVDPQSSMKSCLVALFRDLDFVAFFL